MIKFFRHIRQSMINQNRTKKYLLYAVGEIILVVIGILIALQINNWNELNKNQKEELKLLEEMHRNLTTDFEDCLWNINQQKQLKASNQEVLFHLEQKTSLTDSLKHHYGNLIYSTTQRRNMATYDHLKSRGINLISDDSLRTHITQVYSERYYFIEKMELEYDNPYQLQTLIPLINKNIVINTNTSTAEPFDVQRLYVDHEFKGALRMNIKIREKMMRHYFSLKNDLEDLIIHIQSEIEQPN
ncbi:DUF6090 family protein [Winogradskyella ouciana]|uniref:Uncharacterized protein n=1 Tax=Winogradskyella ouciana TaxID=2608631 RepID=A0A7K1GI98_9FLAO|nr:DUF6090 family protein [Winogradskyella ouciana]MTE27849.1 hypothetical protein [Winogradskyella ouciana]